MPKSLKELFEVYRPKAKDEQDFVDKHVTIKHPDRNGNGDDVFKGNTKKADRKKERHGYEPGEDEKVYEDVEDLDELSRATIGRYSQKAKSIADNEGGKDRTKGRELAGRKNWGGTMKGVEKARVPSTNEETELDEINNPIVKSAPRGYGSSSKKPVSNNGTWTSKNKDRGGNYEQPKIYASAMKKEEVELEEGVMKLSKVHIVHHHDHPAAKEFAKNYTEGMKRDHREGGPTEKDEKASDKFHSRYSTAYVKHGFAGSGTTIYHDHKTGAKWRVDRHPNGKTFYGTDHIISHHVGDIHESVESDYSFTEDEDKVIRSLAGAAEELGEELDLETLAGIAEEVLSELSTDTLKRYRALARFDADDAHHVNDDRRLRKRSAGSYAALKKILKRGEELRAEEVEQIDELSRNTLVNYVDKAFRTAMKTSDSTPEGKTKREKLLKGAGLASKKLGYNEETQIDEISKATMGRYINKAKDQIDAASWRSGYNAAKPNDPKSGKVIAAKERQLSKRHGGIELAVKKLTKEEVEDLDELSKKTLGSYVNRASTQAFGKGYTGGSMIARGDYIRDKEEEKAGEKTLNKGIKRLSGINKAVSRLTKEDIINKAIETYIPEDVELPSLQERLVDKLDEYNLSEAHIHILLSMFDSLNEQNQQRMLDRVNTLEDVNSLLDFAISNRGE